jgi:hypothetical protein
MKFPQFFRCRILTLRWQLTSEIMDTGIGPTGCERMLSIVTSSLLLTKTRARLKTISGLIWPVMISPDLHFRDVHEKMKQTALKRDEEQVQAIVNHLNETMTDPFDIEAHPPCLRCADQSPSRSARTFDNIIWTTTRNISQYLNVDDASHPHFLSLLIRGCTWSYS